MTQSAKPSNVVSLLRPAGGPEPPEAPIRYNDQNLAAWRGALERHFTRQATSMVDERFRNLATPATLADRIRDIPASSSVYLHGNVGVGKTQMAWAWFVKCVVDSNMQRMSDDKIVNLDAFVSATPEHRPPTIRSVSMYTDVDLFDAIRASYNGNGVYNVPDENVLIIDDLGKAKPTEWVAEQLFRVLNRRYVKRLPVFITSEYSPGALAERLAPSIASRIAEMCLVLKMDGADRRLANRGQV